MSLRLNLTIWGSCTCYEFDSRVCGICGICVSYFRMPLWRPLGHIPIQSLIEIGSGPIRKPLKSCISRTFWATMEPWWVGLEEMRKYLICSAAIFLVPSKYLFGAASCPAFQPSHCAVEDQFWSSNVALTWFLTEALTRDIEILLKFIRLYPLFGQKFRLNLNLFIFSSCNQSIILSYRR